MGSDRSWNVSTVVDTWGGGRLKVNLAFHLPGFYPAQTSGLDPKPQPPDDRCGAERQLPSPGTRGAPGPGPAFREMGAESQCPSPKLSGKPCASLPSPRSTHPVTGETLHEAEDGAVEDVRDDAAVALLLPPPAAGDLGWGHRVLGLDLGLGPDPPARLPGARGRLWVVTPVRVT